jgi:hypothetical protein
MSPSLADKLKSLGVKIGAGEIKSQVEIPRKPPVNRSKSRSEGVG